MIDNTIDKEKIPGHIAIIMDGNGRWAQKRGLPRFEGHRAGAAVVKEATRCCLELGIGILSLYTFSTENWRRPGKEVNALMRLLQQHLKRNLPELKKNKIRLVVSGERKDLILPLQRQIQKVIAETKNNSRLILNLALNYGGRQDILQAARAIALKVKRGALQIDEIDQKLFAAHLYTRELPDPDLLIRTAGDKRISNFFLWQISYCEFYFTPKLWPDFKKQDLVEAVLDYQRRERRFGR
ncbi:MAG: isoprenyl transferase [Candidatus Omnitrophica bacterium]|nr:isoprenyl transferase [Candidatus Omnitrophota bacterium]